MSGLSLVGVHAVPDSFPTIALRAGLLAGAGALLLALASVIGRWRARRAAWLRGEPLQPSTPYQAIEWLPVTLLAYLAWATALRGLGMDGSALVALLAAGAGFTLGHAAQRGELLWIGLLSVPTAITGTTAWIWPDAAGLTAGLGFATVHYAWLSRFWRQQLDDGRAWTTAGRLIPAVRAIAVTLAWLTLIAGLTAPLEFHSPAAIAFSTAAPALAAFCLGRLGISALTLLSALACVAAAVCMLWRHLQ